MYCTCGACCEVMWCILWDMRLCDVWVGSQLDEGFNKAPQPTDCHAIAAVTDMVLLAMRESIQSKKCPPVKVLPNIHSIIRLGFTTIWAAASLYANLCMAMVWYVKQTYVCVYIYICIWYICTWMEHVIKTNMVDLYMQRQCVTVGIPHSLIVSCRHIHMHTNVYI